jgi:hypothetical protein
LVLLTEEATVLAIRQFADTAAQRVFADFGAFMLERTIKSLVNLDDSVIDGEQRELAVTMEKVLAHGADRRRGKFAKLVDLEGRLSSTSLH